MYAPMASAEGTGALVDFHQVQLYNNFFVDPVEYAKQLIAVSFFFFLMIPLLLFSLSLSLRFEKKKREKQKVMAFVFVG